LIVKIPGSQVGSPAAEQGGGEGRGEEGFKGEKRGA